MDLDVCITVAKQAACQFSRQRPFLDKDDVQSEAMIIMYDALNSFDPIKGRTLTSWVAFMVHRELKKRFSNALIEVCYDPNLIMATHHSTPEREYIFRETLQNFSEAGKEVVKMVFDGKLEADGKNNVKREIKHRLRNLGYSWCKIQKAFKELRFFANTFA